MTSNSHFELDFTMDETTVLGPPSIRTARGWAYRVDKILSKPGKTMRDTDGKLRFTRAEFMQFSRSILMLLVAYEIPVDVSRIPWGTFRNETSTEDFEADWELLRSWLDER